MAKKKGRFKRFVTEDHRYVFLSTSVIALIGLWLSSQPHTSSSFLRYSYPLECVLFYLLVAWVVVSLVALVNKIVKWHGDAYQTTSPLATPRAKKIERFSSYVAWGITTVMIIDRGIMRIVDIVQYAVTQDSNPSDFLGSMIYMLYQMRSTFLQGILNTIIIAVVGTLVAFVLALVLVFLRLQQIDRSDNDFVRFWKKVGVGFAKVYSTIMRGTPMMIQGLIIYYAGTGMLTARGMTPTEILNVWSPFNAGLVTVSLNSTAYMMEVLRSGILSVDPGQTEAARSLGLSQWQAMRKVVFPQGIRNSIPALSNELVINIKDSSVLMAIGVLELTFAVRSIAGVYYKQMEPYVAAAIVYLILTMVATKLLDKFAKHFDPKAARVVLSTSNAPVPQTKQVK